MLMDPLRAMMPLILAAAVAGAVDITMKCPLDMLKTRLQSTTAKVSMSAMLLDIWRREGVRGLWTGYGATLVRDLPYLIIKWVTYTNMQTLLTALAVRYPFLANAVNLLAGAIAGAIAAIAITPATFDLVKDHFAADNLRIMQGALKVEL